VNVYNTWQLESAIGSHDVWIFKSPIKPFENDFFMGTAGCDSYLSQKAIEAGIAVSNPCYFHFHQTRTQFDRTVSSIRRGQDLSKR